MLDEAKRPLKYADQSTREGWVKGQFVEQRGDVYLTLMPIDHPVSLPKSKAELVAIG